MSAFPAAARDAALHVGRSLRTAIWGREKPSDAGAPPVGLGLQVGYGLGSAASGIGALSLSSGLLMLYFNQVIGIPAVWVGAAIMTTLIVDAFIDPLIGWFSDRLRSPLGRRHTLMYLSAVPAALGFFLMWYAPSGLSPSLLLAFVITMLVFVNVSISLFEIPSAALAPELAPDYDSRSNLVAYRWLFRIVAGQVMYFSLYQFFLRQDEANPLGVLNRERYEEFGLTSAIIIFITILLSTASTHGRIKYLHTPKPQPFSLRNELPQLKTALTHKPLLMIMFGGLMMGFAAGTGFGLLNYFYLHFWALKPQEISYLAFAGLAAAFVSLYLGPVIGTRFGKKRAIIGLYVLWVFTAIGPISLRLLGLMPENGSPLLLPILMGNLGLGLILALCCHIVLGSAIADTIDDITVKTGVRSEGLMFGVYSVLDKVANGGGAFVAGTILSVIAFPTQAVPGTVAPHILTEMAVTQLVIVVIFNIASIAFFTQYNLTREDHERNAAVLAERRALDNAAAAENAGS